MPQEELERDVYATGFFRQKAKSIRGTMRVLLEEFGGEVPRTIDELLRLPGVARKTANVVAAELGNPQGVVVDTHVRRLSQRLGLTRQEDPVKIERDLIKLVPREDWGRFPAPADLARPPGLRRAPAVVHGVRRSTTSARRAASPLRRCQRFPFLFGQRRLAPPFPSIAATTSSSSAATRPSGAPSLTFAVTLLEPSRARDAEPTTCTSVRRSSERYSIVVRAAT